MRSSDDGSGGTTGQPEIPPGGDEGGSEVARPAPARAQSLLSRLPDESGVVLALVVLVVLIGIANPNFLLPRSLGQLLSSAAFTGMLAIGMVFVIVIRDIDLSVGWVFNFSAVVAATVMVAGVNPFIAAGVGILFGGFLGLINGLLAVWLRIPVIIVTLGTLSAYRGLSLIVNNSRAVVPPDQDSIYFAIWDFKLFDVIPSVAIAFILLAVVMHIVLTRSRFGYRAQAMGSNPDAARLAGVPVNRTRVSVLVMMGLVAGLTGVIFLGFRGAIDPITGDGFLLPVIAAVIIGGTPLSGGRGSIFGAVLGALIIQVIQSGILFLGIDAKWSIFVTGAVIVAAVAFDQLVRRRSTRRTRDVVDAG